MILKHVVNVQIFKDDYAKTIHPLPTQLMSKVLASIPMADARDFTARYLVKRNPRLQGERYFTILFFWQNCDLAMRLLAYTLCGHCRMIAQFHVDHAPFCSGHRFERELASGLDDLFSHAPCQLS